MVEIINSPKDIPYVRFNEEYIQAINLNQEMIQAMCISSYSEKNKEVNSRFVNLKFVNGKDFIFFSNYESVKAEEFKDNDKVSVVFYWNKTDTQIRIRGRISQTSREYNQRYFASRSLDKNALAISSRQSKPIDSYDEIISKYDFIKSTTDLTECPKYWGGFQIRPHYFEFWKGHKSRLNKRDSYKLNQSDWIHSFLEP